MLLQISEPNSADNAARERKRGLGIDLGTTNSLVATKSEKGADVIGDASGARLVPSVVNFNGGVTVGAAALELAVSDVQNTVLSAKRFMGRSRDDLSEAQLLGLVGTDPLAFDTGDGPKTPVEVSSEILRALAARANAHADANAHAGAQVCGQHRACGALPKSQPSHHPPPESRGTSQTAATHRGGPRHTRRARGWRTRPGPRWCD